MNIPKKKARRTVTRYKDFNEFQKTLMKTGESRNMPTQKAMEKGYFEIKERTIQNPDGSVRITKTTKVTGKGQVWLTNEFMGDRA